MRSWDITRITNDHVQLPRSQDARQPCGLSKSIEFSLPASRCTTFLPIAYGPPRPDVAVRLVVAEERVVAGDLPAHGVESS